MDGITDFGHFGEHHRRTATNKQVGRKAHRRVGRHARERIAAAALGSHHQVRHGAGFALASVELIQMTLSNLQNIVDHRPEPNVAFVLQAYNAGLVCRNGFDVFGTLEQTLRLQFFAPQANHHHLAAKIRVEGNIMNGTDRHDRRWRVDRYATAIEMVQANHAIDVRVFRQQIAFDDFHHVIHHARHAVYAGGETKKIFGTDAAVRIAIAFKGIAFQWGKRFRYAGGKWQGVQRWRFWQLNQRLLNPASLRNCANGIADDFTVTHDLPMGRNIDQCDFVPLGNMFN